MHNCYCSITAVSSFDDMPVMVGRNCFDCAITNGHNWNDDVMTNLDWWPLLILLIFNVEPQILVNATLNASVMDFVDPFSRCYSNIEPPRIGIHANQSNDNPWQICADRRLMNRHLQRRITQN